MPGPSPTWYSEDVPALPALGPGDWIRALRRGVPMMLILVTGLAAMMLLRLVERPLFGLARPVTPHITVAVCRAVLAILGLRREVRGQRMFHRGAAVANHASWLDIFALNAGERLYFVSKAEVAGWAGIGWLARATGTLFIERDRRAAKAHLEAFRDRLIAGHKLVFFPEGTSTDGLRVLPFKTTLFAAFQAPELANAMWLQPVSIAYLPPEGCDPRVYGWWGGMAFGPHLLSILAMPRHGTVRLRYHPPVAVAQHPDRKALAALTEEAVRAGLEADRGPAPS